MRFPAVRKPPFFHARDEYSSRTPKDFVVLLAAAAPPSPGLWPCSCRRLCGTGGKQSDPCLDAELHGAVHLAEPTAWAGGSPLPVCLCIHRAFVFSVFLPQSHPLLGPQVPRSTWAHPRHGHARPQHARAAGLEASDPYRRSWVSQKGTESGPGPVGCHKQAHCNS